MKLVIIESPFAGDTTRNLAYVRAAMRDCLQRGESPYASHALYPQPGVLDDGIPAERELGIAAGFAWRAVAAATVVYTDLGVTEGMRRGIADADAAGRIVEERTLGGRWDASAATPTPIEKRSCNRHDDCDAADERAKAAGGRVDHCDDECCEECFGS